MFALNLAKLTNRKILKISGPDCYPYLQGLVCNDLRFLYEPDRIPKREHAKSSPSVLSTFMLNAQGRSICDLILYRTPQTRFECQFTPPGKATEPDELLIECDSTLASGLANTLYGYRVRRKVELSMENNLTTFVLFPQINDYENHHQITREVANNKIENDDSNNQQQSMQLMKPFEATEILSDNLTIVSDPRLTSLGLRIISKEPNISNLRKSLESIINTNIQEVSQKDYTVHRYFLGVGEGFRDHPESNCFPLECNADFLGSVSFDKGCYLGQELTARIHHTGVVRKRLMPIILDLQSTTKEKEFIPLIDGSDIIDSDSKKKVGILRNVVKNRALALLRHELAFKSENMIHEGSKTRIKTFKPYWWPAATTN